jgi:hypothetical protein
MRKPVLLAIVLLGSLLVVAQKKTTERLDKPETWAPPHPDWRTSDLLEKTFTLPSALESLSRIRSSLESFAHLTNESRAGLGKNGLQRIGNTDPTLQCIGFKNMPSAVEGTLLAQNVEIKRLQLELEKRQRGSGEFEQAYVEKSREEYLEALRQFRKFWDSHPLTD